MITGTIVNYYFHCKRQCWLFYNHINLEENSEDVRMGRILHKLKSGEDNEIAIDNIKIDKITSDYVVEIKKSDADIDAAIAQLEFYLMTLNKKGIKKKGKLECIEKNKQDKKTYYVEINDEMIKLLNDTYKEIENFLLTEFPPAAIYMPKCKKCAYYEYCYI